jgi:hypothetical protein
MATKTIREQGGGTRPGLTSEQVWPTVARASFAVLSHVTPAGEPRSSGVVYKTSGEGWPSRSRPAAGRPGTSQPTAGWP